MEKTREHLKISLKKIGLSVDWVEWDSDNPECSDDVRTYGSPTILVNGNDVGNQSPGYGNCCRLYSDNGKHLVPVPPISLITTLLEKENIK